MSRALDTIERWVILTDSLQDARTRSAALEGLRSALEAVRTGARQLRLTHGLPTHLQDLLRETVRGWPEQSKFTERLRCYGALVDAVSGTKLQEWRAKWSTDSFGAPTDRTSTQAPSTFDAAAEFDFSRERKIS